MPDDFDPAALMAALDQTEAAGAPPHLVEQLRALVRTEELRRAYRPMRIGYSVAVDDSFAPYEQRLVEMLDRDIKWKPLPSDHPDTPKTPRTA